MESGGGGGGGGEYEYMDRQGMTQASKNQWNTYWPWIWRVIEFWNVYALKISLTKFFFNIF